MSKEKNGCSVKLSLVCTDEEGRGISDIPTGGWYGMERKTANALAMDLNEAITAVIDRYNKLLFGDDYRPVLAAKTKKPI